MRAQIWKYQIPITGRFEIEMPGAAQIISIQMQNEVPYVWAIVGPKITPSNRRFKLVGTGHEFDFLPTDKFIGTFQDGPYVWHLFEIL